MMTAKRFDEIDNKKRMFREVNILAGLTSFPKMLNMKDFTIHNSRYFIIAPHYGNALDLHHNYSLK